MVIMIISLKEVTQNLRVSCENVNIDMDASTQTDLNKAINLNNIKNNTNIN